MEGVWELVILTLDNPPWAKPSLKGQAGLRLPTALLRVLAALGHTNSLEACLILLTLWDPGQEESPGRNRNSQGDSEESQCDEL